MRLNEHLDGQRYDVIVVGAGAAGSLIAKQLGHAGRTVLVLEAGTGDLDTWPGHQAALDTYYTALNKHENSPYPPNPAAPSPTEDLGAPPRLDYYVQRGGEPYASTYLRALGGSMLHWQGVTPRMLPDDLQAHSTYGIGLHDWPISFGDLEKWYEVAEFELGVAGNAQRQREQGEAVCGIRDPHYEYPMRELPLSYQDRVFQQRLAGLDIAMSDGAGGYVGVPVDLYPVAQARNSAPNGDYRPVGAVGLYDYGERCNGNSNCIPICPVQAKYTPLKTQRQFDREHVDVVTHAVVSRVLFEDQEEGGYATRPRAARGTRVVGVEYSRYDDPRTASGRPGRAHADVVVLAAHAVENAKLLLASGARDRNEGDDGPIGRYLMDHPVLVTWALMDQSIGAYRGPMSTASIDGFRNGGWRRQHAAFRIEPDNWGWSLPTKSPTTDVQNLIHHGDERAERGDRHVLGRALRERLASRLPRQIQLSFSMEQPADPANRVTVDDGLRDALGNHRPVVEYHLSDYVKEGFVVAREVSRKIFERLGAHDVTDFGHSPNAIPLSCRDHALAYWGGSHAAGTHIMGADPATSVVDPDQESHDHPNLYVVGSGSMPSMGTSNPSLTLAALALRTARCVEHRLAELHRPVVLADRPAHHTAGAAR